MVFFCAGKQAPQEIKPNMKIFNSMKQLFYTYNCILPGRDMDDRKQGMH